MKFFRSYGDVLLIDGTYSTNRRAIALYTIVVIVNHGNTQPVGYFLLRSETQESISSALKIFAEVTLFSILTLKIMLNF